ncbi:MAG: GspE/PulE family protein [Nitrospinota bacterium]
MDRDANEEVTDIETHKPSKAKKLPLGARLVNEGLISSVQLELGLREQKRLGIYLGEALSSLGFISEEMIAQALGEETNTKLVNIRNAVIAHDVLNLIPYELARRHKMMVLSKTDDEVHLVIADALNVVAMDIAEKKIGSKVTVVTAASADILDAIERNYAQAGTIESIIQEVLARRKSGDSDSLEEEAPMIRLIDQLISLAVQLRATDIHIEPEDKVVRVRMRIDGTMTQQVLIPKDLQSSTIARIKIMSNLNVTEKRLPQDGRITFLLGVQAVDLRISTLPTIFGENIVIRVLDKGNITLKLKALGVFRSDRDRIEQALNKSGGIILVTGPTGSGKSSTLYASLSMVNRVEMSVYTLEDPIEYQLPMIRQTHVNPGIGMTFANGLRALLRQDPDIIMVGEIRDCESAELAIRAAMTGHLVLSTLHTNNAASAVARLLDMKIEPFLLTSALSLVIAQRLVRKICNVCKVEIKDPELLLANFSMVSNVDAMKGAKLWHGTGCSNCGGRGYKGRTGIYELLKITEKVREAILQGQSAKKINDIAKSDGFSSMLEDGIAKALEGITTITEVLRVAK